MFLRGDRDVRYLERCPVVVRGVTRVTRVQCEPDADWFVSLDSPRILVPACGFLVRFNIEDFRITAVLPNAPTPNRLPGFGLNSPFNLAVNGERHTGKFSEQV